MVNKIKQILDSFKNKTVNVWQHGVISMPVLTVNDFDWSCEEHENYDEYLVFYDGENKIQINIDEIHNIVSDELMGEVVIYMNNDMLLQVWIEV